MKKFTLLVLSLSLVLGSLTVSAGAAGTKYHHAELHDVYYGSWFYDAVTQCADNGYVSGVGNNKFMPEGKLTYAQGFTMLTNAFFKTEKQDYEDNRWMQMDEYFGGNPEWWSYNAYYFNDKGFLDGTSVNIKSSASANSPITRYEMVQIVNNILKSKGITVSSADKAAAQLKISDWSSVPVKYHDAVSTCFSLGIVNGYSGNRFVGTDTLTRAQACVILSTLVNIVAEGGSAKPPVTEPEEPELKPIYEYCDCTCDACRDCQGTIVGYEPVEKPSGPSDKPGVPVETTKEIEITTKVTQYGTGYYVADNGFGTGKLNNGKAITEDNVLELLDEAQRIWPDGITWTVPNTYNNNWYQSSGILVDNLLHSNGYNTNSNFACGGFAAMLSDYIFGQKGNPFHRVYDPMDIRAGDIIVIKNADGTVKHISFAQTSTIQSGTYAGRLWTADGNTSGKVSWSTATKQQYGVPVSEAFQAQFNPGRTWEVWSRYPA